MIIRRSRILKTNKNEMSSLRSIIRSNTRKRISESVMKAGSAHRRRTFGTHDPYADKEKTGPLSMRKELK